MYTRMPESGALIQCRMKLAAKAIEIENLRKNNSAIGPEIGWVVAPDVETKLNMIVS